MEDEKKESEIDFGKVLEWIREWEDSVEEKEQIASRCLLLTRQKSLKKKEFGDQTYLPYQAKWLYEYHDTPKEPNCISHVCGDGRCINLQHMMMCAGGATIGSGFGLSNTQDVLRKMHSTRWQHVKALSMNAHTKIARVTSVPRDASCITCNF